MSVEYKGLSLSGGSTKISGIAGSAIAVLREYDYKPTHMTGISAGATIVLPLAMGLYDEVEEWVQTYELSDIFNKKPVNEKGDITLGGIVRVSTGKESLGKQDQLSKTISKLVSKKMFHQYQTNDKYPVIYVGRVGFKTGKRHYENLKECSYEMALEAINASASIPVMVESRKFQSEFWFDGGMRDHLGSHWLMEQLESKMDEHISIYARPRDYNIAKPEWTPKNALVVLERMVDILMMEKSKNDEFKEDILAEKYGIKNTKIFLPIISESTYQFDHATFREWYQKGKNSARAAMDAAGY